MADRDLRSSLFVSVIVLSLLLTLAPHPSVSWSQTGHGMMTEAAVEHLPDGWREFFQTYSDFLSDASIWPDTRLREEDPMESSRHWYDSEFPLEEHLSEENIEVCREDPYGGSCSGLLPWAVENMTRSMTENIRAEEWRDAMVDAGIAAHYLADMTQPYHSTVDYDPPVSTPGLDCGPGFEGKHSFMDRSFQEHSEEVQLPEEVELEYVPDVFQYVMDTLEESYGFLPSLNATVFNGTPCDPTDDVGWNQQLRDIVENRTRTAVEAIANVWYTAIIDADALDSAPNPDAFKALTVELSLEPLDEMRAVRAPIQVSDALGIEMEGYQVEATLGGEPVETESFAGSLYVTIDAETLARHAGETVELSVVASKQGYQDGTATQVLTVPEGETQGLPTSLVLLAVAVLVLVAAGLVWRKTRS